MPQNLKTKTILKLRDFFFKLNSSFLKIVNRRWTNSQMSKTIFDKITMKTTNKILWIPSHPPCSSYLEFGLIIIRPYYKNHVLSILCLIIITLYIILTGEMWFTSFCGSVILIYYIFLLYAIRTESILYNIILI